MIRARRVFSPRDLFIGGTRGFWYDVSDLSSIFTGSGGTGDVSADGDAIGYLKDKSGQGNDAVRLTDDTHRGIFRVGTNGTVWMECVTSPSTPTGYSIPCVNLFNNVRYGTLIAGVRFTAFNIGSNQFVVYFSTNTATSARCAIENDNGQANVHLRARTADADAGTNLLFSATAGRDSVLLGEFNFHDRSGVAMANGEWTSNYGTFPASAGATSATDSAAASLVAQRSGGTESFNGRFYGAIGLDRQLTMGEKLQVMRWMADKVGIGRFN